MEAVLKRRHVVLTDSEDKDAENSSKQGRNLQEEGLDEMVRSIMKDKSEVFETPTQGKTSREADISLEGLEAAETLAKVLTQRTKTYTRKVKTGLKRKLDAEEINTSFTDVSTAFTDVNTAFEEIKSGDDEVNSGDESIIPSPKKGQREGKAALEEKSQSKRTKKQIREEKDALIAKRVQDELELSETQKNRMAQKIGQLKKLKPDELKEEFDKCVEKVENFIPMNSELEASKLKRTGINLQAKVFKKQKITDVPDVTKDESVKREEEFKVQQLILRYNIRKYLARKGLQKNKFESARSDTEEDVEAYMDERVDEPSSKEFQKGSIPQGSAPAKFVKWQILKTGKKGAYQIIREDHTDIVYVNFQVLLNDLTRDDLKELYRMIMLKYGDSRPEEEYERVAHIYMLTEVKYPLPSRVCQAMLEKKLIEDRKDECFDIWIGEMNVRNGVEKNNTWWRGTACGKVFLKSVYMVNSLPISFLKDMDSYRDEGMSDIIIGEPFLREVGIKAKRFEGIITLYNGDDEVSEKDVKNGILHAYQKLKGFYKGVLNLGPN
ncbi:hypothetical protein Tco_1007323 [Tanacetum coccineum]